MAGDCSSNRTTSAGLVEIYTSFDAWFAHFLALIWPSSNSGTTDGLNALLWCWRRLNLLSTHARNTAWAEGRYTVDTQIPVHSNLDASVLA